MQLDYRHQEVQQNQRPRNNPEAHPRSTIVAVNTEKDPDERPDDQRRRQVAEKFLHKLRVPGSCILLEIRCVRNRKPRFLGVLLSRNSLSPSDTPDAAASKIGNNYVSPIRLRPLPLP